MLRILFIAFAFWLTPSTAWSGKPLRSTLIKGDYVDLLKGSRKLAKLSPTDLTVEFWIRPSKASVARKRSIVFVMTNQGGRDAKTLSLILHQGKPHSTVFGTNLRASKPLQVDSWSHIAMTLNATTVNKRARLWVNGRQIEEKLVLQVWPSSFFYVGMFGDPWLQTRVFSGRSGGIRISRIVRYKKPFSPVSSFKRDKNTLLIVVPKKPN